MLAIRMQRTGRKGHAMFRVVVQDARRTPTSGKVVAHIGSYDPHSKTVTLKKDKVSFYLEHGAQPSERVVKLLVSEGVALPAWVKQPTIDKQRAIRNLDKLRRNKQEDEDTAKDVAAPAAEQAETTEIATEAPTEISETTTKEVPEAPADAAESTDTVDEEKTDA